ncbi:MAG TPA: protein kinase, partial [Polyangiales bacterium]|nr:protein kinase [Polyangiales bacterium]
MAKPPVRNGEIVDGRYRLGDALGGGGMAVVYEATELNGGRRLALKQLRAHDEPTRQRRTQELFEHEFRTLVELAHPRIVRVYDYASTESGTYYTMELLDGGDLQQLVPLPWPRVCAFARDICFALSIVHSRRLVYRDLSPRNVRCTSDGVAKLIDFGALALAGHRPQAIVGTPAFCAPETVQLQVLDARTDLYSLGATLYFALTGTHPYLGGDFDSIEFAWQTPPVPPRERVPDLPAALERLVLDLLQLDPDARPASAVEVIERLCAIDGTPIDEALLFANVDLATPRFVGREAPLRYARDKLARAYKGRGNALLFDGPAGVGRSRLLEACVLSAKLDGAAVLTGNADAATHGDYGVVRSLARAALEVYSADALELARPTLGVLGHALPELHRRAPDIALQSFESDAAQRAALQPALRAWLFGLSRLRPLVLAVDDLQGVDEPSASALAVLAHDLSSERIGMLMTLDSGVSNRAPAAIELISQSARRVPVEPLALDATQALLGSIFGDVPHLASLAHRSHEIARGNPRDLVQLARHLVDQKQIHYHAGAWVLPERFDEANLPRSIVFTLQARLARLDADALDLARAFALEPEQRLDFEACLLLTEHTHAGRLLRSLTALVQEEVVRLTDEHYMLAQAAWSSLLLSGASQDTVRGLHRRLARVAERSGADELRIARHLLLAGDEARAVELLIVDGERSQEKLRGNPEAFLRYARALPPDWLQLYGQLLALCDAQGRPQHDAYKLRTRIGAFAALMGIRDDVHGPQLLAQLTELSGLADYATLPAEGAPVDRLRRALEAAKARYDARPEALRVVDPLTAVRQLGRLIVQLTGSYVATLDVPACRALPNVAPLAVLSPAFEVIAKLVEGTLARITGVNARVRVVMREVLERTAQPDRAGLDPSYHHYARLVVMSGIGIVEAGMGLASSLEWAAAIEGDPTAQVKALEIQMLYHLWQGNARESARCKGRAEVLQIQNNPREWAKGVHLPWQAAAYAACDDLTHTKRALDEIAPFAERFPGWEPVVCYARGEYERLRGDHAAALRHLQRGLSLTAAGEHQTWVHLAGAELRVLLALGRGAEALANGRSYAAAATRAGLAQLESFVQLPLALALAQAGEGFEAISACEQTLASLTAAGTTGVLLGLVHETRALVADALGDDAGAQESSAQAVRIYRAYANAALSAKSERLKFGLQLTATRNVALRNEVTSLTRVALILASCPDIHARARTAL